MWVRIYYLSDGKEKGYTTNCNDKKQFLQKMKDRGIFLYDVVKVEIAKGQEDYKEYPVTILN